MSLPEEDIGKAAKVLGRWMQSQGMDFRDSLLLCQSMAGYALAQISNNAAEFEINLKRLTTDVEALARRAWAEKK